MSKSPPLVTNLGISENVFAHIVKNNSTSPFYTTLGMHLVALGSGYSELVLTVADAHLNPWHTLHGGIMSTMLDAAMGAVVRTLGFRGVTIDLNTHFLSPAYIADTVIATGKLISHSRHIFIVEAYLSKQQNDKILATARSTFYNKGNLLS